MAAPTIRTRKFLTNRLMGRKQFVRLRHPAARCARPPARAPPRTSGTRSHTGPPSAGRRCGGGGTRPGGARRAGGMPKCAAAASRPARVVCSRFSATLLKRAERVLKAKMCRLPLLAPQARVESATAGRQRRL